MPYLSPKNEYLTAENAQKIVDTLKRYGPMTTKEISVRVGLSPSRLSDYLSYAKKNGFILSLCHIHGPHGGQQVPVYEASPGREISAIQGRYCRCIPGYLRSDTRPGRSEFLRISDFEKSPKKIGRKQVYDPNMSWLRD